MRLLLFISAWAAAASWGGFLVWYSLRARWWARGNAVGQNTFQVSLLLFAVMLRSALYYTWPSIAIRWTGVIFFLWAAYLGLQRLYLMDKAQQEMALARQENGQSPSP